MELALRFLSSPWKIYKNGDYAMRQTVLRLAFAAPLRYSQNSMYGTPELSFPFKYLGGFSGQKSEMVQREGKGLNSQFNLSDEELSALFEALEQWEYHLARVDPEGLRCENEHFRP
jgi:hypothetical protein